MFTLYSKFTSIFSEHYLIKVSRQFFFRFDFTNSLSKISLKFLHILLKIYPKHFSHLIKIFTSFFQIQKHRVINFYKDFLKILTSSKFNKSFDKLYWIFLQNLFKVFKLCLTRQSPNMGTCGGENFEKFKYVFSESWPRNFIRFYLLIFYF